MVPVSSTAFSAKAAISFYTSTCLALYQKVRLQQRASVTALCAGCTAAMQPYALRIKGRSTAHFETNKPPLRVLLLMRHFLISVDKQQALGELVIPQFLPLWTCIRKSPNKYANSFLSSGSFLPLWTYISKLSNGHDNLFRTLAGSKPKYVETAQTEERPILPGVTPIRLWLQLFSPSLF